MDYWQREKLSIRWREAVIIFLVLLFAFERALITYIPVLGYADEVFAIVTVAGILISLIEGSRKLSGLELILLVLLLFSFNIGLISNYYSGLQSSPIAIVTDIISTYKIFLAYYWIALQSAEQIHWDGIIRVLASICRALVVIMLACLIGAYIFGSELMLSDGRYGLPALQFLFNVPGNFSKLFYFIIPLLSADLYMDRSFYKKVMIVFSLLVWISTLRSRAIAFAFCYLLFAFWYFYLKNKRKTKINIVQIIPFVILAVILGWNQIAFYLLEGEQARGVLWRYSFVTMAKYFPFGSGFGTYASDVTVDYGSSLYAEYGFDKVYGLGYVHMHFLNDNYWPMIIGQLGFFGVVLIGLVVYLLYRYLLTGVSANKYFHFATLCAAGFLLASSIASKSYSEFSSIPVLMLHGILLQRERATRNEQEKI